MDILFKFAKKHSIEKSEVKKFIKKYTKDIKKVEELLCVPLNSRNHYDNVAFLPDTFTDFLQKYIALSRNEVISLETILKSSEQTLKHYNDMTIPSQNNEETILHYEPKKKKFEKEFEEIKKILVELKFGSAIWDW